jgi:hypothetical protein
MSWLDKAENTKNIFIECYEMDHRPSSVNQSGGLGVSGRKLLK